MTVAITYLGKSVVGNKRNVWGTLTSAAGDTQVVLSNSDHGLGNIIDAKITLEEGAIEAPIPKITISGATVTADFRDMMGLSGRWVLLGNK